MTTKAQLNLLYAHINPERIGFLRFILEGYDGLAQASTACPKSALVTLRYHYKNRATLISILDSLEEKLVNQKSRLIK